MANSREIIYGDLQILGNLEVLDGIASGDLTEAKDQAERSYSDLQFVTGDVTQLLSDLADLESDGKLTESEKLVVQREWDNIEAEKPKVDEFAAHYGFEAGNAYYDTYDTEYDDLDYYLNTDPAPLSDLGTTTTLTQGTLRSHFADYFEAREDLFQAIATGEVMHAPADEDLLFHISMDDDVGGAGDEIQDSSGNAHVGTITGAPTWSPGVNGTSLLFANNQSVALAVAMPALTAWSLTGWANLSTLDPASSAAPRIVEIRQSSDDAFSTLYYNDGVDKFEAYLNDQGAIGAKSATADDAAVADQWYFLVLTYDGTTLKLYVDGVLQTDTEAASGMSFTPNENAIAAAGNSPTTNNFEGYLDEIRGYKIALTQENVNFLHKIPGGPTQSVVTNSRVANLAITAEKIALKTVDTAQIADEAITDALVEAASLTSRSLAFGGDESILTNDEEFLPALGELFPLDRTLLSSEGRIPVVDTAVVIEPGVLTDSDENEYDNPRAKEWGGLTGDPHLEVIGVWKAAVNHVEDPEDLTTANWSDAGTITAELMEEEFDGHKWNKLTGGAASQNQRLQTIDTSGFSSTTPSIQALCKKGSGGQDRAKVLFYDQTATTIRCEFYVDWENEMVEGVTGTLVDEDWYDAETVHVSVISTTITPANTHNIRCYASDDSVADEYNYYTAVMVEDSDYPTPYTPTSRPTGVIEYRKQLQDEGAIECWVRPRFTYDDTENHYVWCWWKDSTHFFVLYYAPSLDEFVLTYRWGGTQSYLYQQTNYTNSTLWNWIHIKAVWDFSAGTGELIINGSSVDSAWSGTPDTYDGTGWNFFVGSRGDAVRTFDGEIADLPIFISEDATTTHYTADQPWRDPFSISNYNQSFSVGRKTLKSIRGEIANIDKHHRLTRIGSRGLEMLDRAGNIIHDTPDAPMLVNNLYLGHIFWFNNLTDYELEDTSTPTMSGWQDVTCLTTGINNVRGVVLDVYLKIAWTAQAAVGGWIYFRPDGWTGSVAVNPFPCLGNYIEASGAQMETFAIRGMIIVPVSSDNVIEYYIDPEFGSVASKYLLITQLGVIV